MGRVILQRIAGAIPVVLLVTLITFGLMRLIPGDVSAALGGVSSSPAEREQIRRNLGLDQPAHVQLVKWYGGPLPPRLRRPLFPREPPPPGALPPPPGGPCRTAPCPPAAPLLRRI